MDFRAAATRRDSADGSLAAGMRPVAGRIAAAWPSTGTGPGRGDSIKGPAPSARLAPATSARSRERPGTAFGRQPGGERKLAARGRTAFRCLQRLAGPQPEAQSEGSEHDARDRIGVAALGPARSHAGHGTQRPVRQLGRIPGRDRGTGRGPCDRGHGLLLDHELFEAQAGKGGRPPARDRPPRSKHRVPDRAAQRQRPGRQHPSPRLP